MTSTGESSLRRRAVEGEKSLKTNDLASQTAEESKFKQTGSSSTKRNSCIVLAVLTVLAFATRFYKIHEPNEVVFDEVHFGKFGSYYLRREYFFDVHPPLAKLLIAAMGWFVGFDGHFLFEEIGNSYQTENVPYIPLRSLLAVFGSLLVPVVYETLRECGFSIVACTVCACLVIFDNTLVTQSRLILLDSILILFMALAIYSYVRFYKLRNRSFSGEWWFWLLATGVNIALTTSVKMVGLFVVGLIGICVLMDLWRLLDVRRGLTLGQVGKHFMARALSLIVVPVIIYLSFFYIHFAILTKSGTGDAFMSNSFQATLEGNDMHANSMDVRYFDNITLLHKGTKVYLHSHPLRYPLRYDDGRISSQGQQVTGYPHKEDPNNHWTIRPGRELFEEDYEDEMPKVKNGDIIQLVHIGTGSILLTHDVASPLMPTNTEFTTIPIDDTSRFNETLFRISIEDGVSDDATLKTKSSGVKFIHLDTGVALWTHGEALPDWASGQQEVNGNKNPKDNTNIWTIDEIIGKDTTDETFVPRPVQHLNFFVKFWELQKKMIAQNSQLVATHPFQSQPISWPFVIRGISFWTRGSDRSQIYFLPNPFGWVFGYLALTAFIGVLFADQLALRRNFHLIDPILRKRLHNVGGYLLLGWALHYFPFFLMGRSLFLHHYLPAIVLNYMVVGVLFQFIFIKGIEYPISLPAKGDLVPVYRPRAGWVAYLAALLIIGAQVGLFVFFAPLTYGHVGLDVDQVLARKWLDSWDFHFAK
ncbi:glycosyltransferase family 39 protein [Basidiobolus meristosporus CBS 931.73]|uniref:Dolichyl-phosphate-mannose--protein mannosyltransferase n=1 Tax=Basidiobolus meristosporus CBS 931.73 TaxID=1314790 RepID=A0A1Y1Z5F4_9FUNG|nr:glycosyltransferase family 39 protein [Basidiobolus meristosporus CBS 931.73]|eukprot:ORY05207.1 glycosyltransferase family 39 protein [Basidiobolus meristosporus CBS 931.73]